MFRTEFIGNLTVDPEIRKVGENQVCNFSVAINRRLKNGEERTAYVRVAVWGAQAEACHKYLKKGRKVYAEGEIGASAYTNKEGKSVASLELNNARVEFLDSPATKPQETNYDAPVEVTDEDGELPF